MILPPLLEKERDTKGESKRGSASLPHNHSPFPLIRGRGRKGDGVAKQI